MTSLAALGIAILLFTAGCGGGGGGQSGDRHGTDTPPSISHIDQILGIQGTLYADPNGYVTVNYHLQDNQYDPSDVEIQYGVDLDGSDQIEDDEYVAATPAPGSEGTVQLNSSPGGAGHSFIWDSVANIGTNRYVNQDYDYTPDGRRARDGFGDVIFRVKPGVKFRIRPVTPLDDGVWRYTDSFSISNNHAPQVTSFAEADVVIPPEGIADNSVNEIVNLQWQGKDEDGDPVTIAVDYLLVDDTFDPSALSQEDLEGQPWQWATSAPVAPLSEGTAGLSMNPAGSDVPHWYGWDSIADAGTAKTHVMLRVRPIDGKNEVGDWIYLDRPFFLKNFAVFTQLESLDDARTGHRATLLTNGNVLLTGGKPGAGAAADDSAAIFFPTNQSQTLSGSTAPISGGMVGNRAGHTATRLFREEDPTDATKLLDAKVLIVGGEDETGKAQATAEIYDPGAPAGQSPFHAIPAMATPRKGHVAVLLSSGKVLVAGGVDDNGTALRTAEIYDPDAEDPNDPWETVPTLMGVARTGAGAVTLPGLEGSMDEDGFVLIAGGDDGSSPTPTALASIEVYDVVLGEFLHMDTDNDLNDARTGHSLTPTLDDAWAVVAAGGEGSPPMASIERYDQQTESWTTSSVSMGEDRSGHVALLQGDGTVLLAGGVTDAVGNFAATAEIYDPGRDTIRLANGEIRETVTDAAAVVLTNGRSVLFGGDNGTGTLDTVQAFTPETEDGFNAPPTVDIRTPTAVEPWAFGVRIYFRTMDAEGDEVRIVAQYKVKESLSDSTSDPLVWTQDMKDDYLDRWLPAAMQPQTVLGDASSGSSGLETRTDVVTQQQNPIDNPDDPNTPSDRGEHLFIWKTAADLDPVKSLQRGGLPKGDYDNVYFRIIVYGANEGNVATSGSFGMTKNAPVIARIDPPIQDADENDKVYGNVVFPYYLQDSDPGQYARVEWYYGLDLNGDGKIVDGQFYPGLGTETWRTATWTDPSVVVTLNGVNYQNPATFADLPTAATGNEHGQIPWGVKYHVIWDAVRDLGAPLTPQTNVIFKATPYDYPTIGTPVEDQSLGIGSERGGWTYDADPNGLYLVSWSPTVNNIPDPGVFEYTGVGTNEPIEFRFSKPVANVSDSTITVTKKGSTVTVPGVFVTSGATVTWYPQVDELPHPTGILEDDSDYTITMYGYDPVFSGRDILHAAGADPKDTNAYNLLWDGTSEDAFQTGTGAYEEWVSPSYSSPLVTPSSGTNVDSGLTKIEMRFDEFLDPATVNHDNFEVYVERFSNVRSVVPGTFTLENRTSPAGVQTALVIYTFAGTLDLPYGQTVQIRAKTGLKDLFGNALGAEATPNFVVENPGGSSGFTWNEGFDGVTYRDYDETTVWWGDNDPKYPGDFAGYGTDSEVTGLFDFGNGQNGTATIYGGTWTSTSTDNLRQYVNLTVPYGYTLTLRGTHPWTFRCTGSATVAGTINASGSTGGSSVWRNSTGSLASGGAGGPGGGQGSSSGSWTDGASTPITYNDAKNYLGVTSGTGVGGSGVGIMSTYTYYPRYMAGGGGAGHGTTGQVGYHGYGNAGGYYPNGGYMSIKGGSGGAAYGTKEMTGGPTAGSGGGSGGTKISRYYSASYYFAHGGAGGGGGGGIFRLIAAGGIDLQSTGRIWAKGGTGGTASYNYSYINGRYVYSYPGGGGGGSGGSIDLQAPSMDLDGEIDVSGGAGGRGSYTYSSFNNTGGDGAGGRVRLAMTGSVWMVNAEVTSAAATITCGGGGTSPWTVSSNTTVNTTTGAGGVGWNSASKQFRVSTFTVNSGVTLTVTGENPFVVIASGDVSLKGKIVAKGEDAKQRTSYDYTGSSTSGYYHYDEYRTSYTYYQDSMTAGGGPGGGTGGSRGAKRTYTNYYGWYHLPSAISSARPSNGGGWNSSTGTSGAGLAGREHSTGYRRYYYTKYYYYYYYGGSGGGGASVLDGTVGKVNRTYSGYGGTPGAGGTANVDLASMTPATVRGGAGGGGGVMGGIYITTYNYRYCRDGGNSGGGGGGAIGICSDGSIHIDGTIDVRGGMGGSQLYTYYYYNVFSGAGGGGGGGNIRMHAKNGFTFGAPSIDCGGGEGGITTYYSPTSTPNTEGGDGGKGGLRLTAPVDPKTTTMPTIALSASGVKLGSGGTLHVAPFSVSDTAQSTFWDTVGYTPDYQTVGWGGTGLKSLEWQGAHSHPETGAADPDNVSNWTTSLATLDGYRYVRFRLTINAGAAVTYVQIGGTR